MKVRASEHASARGRERFALKPASVLRMAEIARARGLTPEQTAGGLRRYLDRKQAAHPHTWLRVYGEVVFIFRADVLVTFWPLPGEHKATVAKIRAALQREASVLAPE